MKVVQITIRNCECCPHHADTHLRAPYGRGFLAECRYYELPRLIQIADEQAPFPDWCQLEDKC